MIDFDICSFILLDWILFPIVSFNFETDRAIDFLLYLFERFKLIWKKGKKSKREDKDVTFLSPISTAIFQFPPSP